MQEESNPPATSQPGGATQSATAYTEAAARFSASGPAGAFAPFQVGRYRVLRLIGEGGMGAVYEAEQDHPRRNVALKLIKAGLASPSLLHRFEHEAPTLGTLDRACRGHIETIVA